MAKGAYIGVGGVARKVKKGYIGVPTDVPIYSEETKTVPITASNIAEYFEVTNGSYYFAGSGSTFTSNNGGVKNSTASTVLKAKQDISSLSFSYSYSSEKSYDKFTLKVAGTAVENAVSGPTTSKTYSGSLTAGQTVEFIYAKDSSNDSNDDECTFSAMSITATVRTQIGAETKEVARKIKKAYIGIGSVARPCWAGGELAYYGTISALRRIAYGTASIGNYALFAGGLDYSSGSGTNVPAVTTCNSSLTVGTAADLDNYSYGCSGTTIKDTYAVFYGGKSSTSSARYSEEGIYDTSLTKLSASGSVTLKYNAASASIGDYALFAGGKNSSILPSAGIQYVDASLTTQDSGTGLSKRACELAATTVGNYALFGGGYGSEGPTDIVEVYDGSLTKTTQTALSVARYGVDAATIGGFAIFAGGNDSDKNSTTTVDVYDEYLTRTSGTELSTPRNRDSNGDTAPVVGNYALFGGHTNSSSGNTYPDTLEVYMAS